MVYNSLDIDQITCTGAYLISRNNGTYDMILKYVTDDGRKVTIEGIVSYFRPQINLYDGSGSGNIDFVLERNIDKGNNLFTMRIEDK